MSFSSWLGTWLSSWIAPLFGPLLGPENASPRWESSQWLAFAPFLLLLIWLSFRKARGASPNRELPHATRLWTDADGVSTKAPLMRGRKTRGVFYSLGILLTLVALCRPQWGEIEEVTFDQHREIIIGLDLSQSMLTDDIQPSRLERSKLLIGSLLDQLKGERVGLALFAGTAFLQSPLSADHEVLRDLLVDLDPSFLPQGGTRYEALLQTALDSFSKEGEADRFLVILSDGESHEENWRALLPRLREHDIHVIGLGVGTVDGGLVPGPRGGLLKDSRGAAVLSRLQPSTLQALAKETKGLYREASVWVDIAQLVEHSVAQGAKGEFIDKRQTQLHERFQLFMALALLFLFFSYLWEFPVTPRARQLRVGDASQANAASKKSKRSRPDFFGEGRGEGSSAASNLFLLLALSSLFLVGQPASAQASPEAVKPPGPLETLVGQLANKEKLLAEDYGSLAQESLNYASQPPPEARAGLGGIIEDGLSAVARGEGLDSQAMPWDQLRSALLQLQEQERQKQEQQN
ncbi:MAG: VWA domain-containing protein [Deltaproteobacteria bacterium]|nr:VWA domain-containing protein [Deltaproteobacteria bacterium]